MAQASPKRKNKSIQQKTDATQSKRKPSASSLESVVGEQVYRTWVDMLSTLVPDGRTERLSVLVAAMIQYAFIKADEKRDTDESAIVQALLNSMEISEPSEVDDLLQDAVKKLFRDARVKYGRTSARGEDYSIIEEAYTEYIHWFDMPWEW